MKKASTITVVDTNTLRGVLAPSSVVSKKLLEDMVDFIELSAEQSAKESADLVKDGDAKQSWVTLKAMKKLAEKKD